VGAPCFDAAMRLSDIADMSRHAPQEQYAPPPGPPPGVASGAGSLNPPALPERRESGAQADDLEDVKKVGLRVNSSG
jgi:hypothetical protein